MLCSENFFFHLCVYVLSYQLILCLFEAFQSYARTSHPLKKVRLYSLLFGCTGFFYKVAYLVLLYVVFLTFGPLAFH